MTTSPAAPGRRGRAVLTSGDRIVAFGTNYTVIDLDGLSVRLHQPGGGVVVVSLVELTCAEDFAVIDQRPATTATLPPVGLLDRLPEELIEHARWWQRHIVEVDTGLPLDAADSALPRQGYDPRTTTLADRASLKAQELTVAGIRTSVGTVQRKRLRYGNEGLWGLVDHRALRQSTPGGRTDPRVLAALDELIAEQTTMSTGTRARMHEQLKWRLQRDHPQDAAALMPSTATINRRAAELATGLHTWGDATTRRSLAMRPSRPFGRGEVWRPGQLVELDTTPLDVLAFDEAGHAVRPELTYALDVATRTICAAAWRPEATKAVDASLLLARMLVPAPIRPHWPNELGMRAASLPAERLIAVDPRLEHAMGRPVIVPEAVSCDQGAVFVSATFTAACSRLGIDLLCTPVRQPTSNAFVERGFGSIGTLFTQYLAGTTGRTDTRRGRPVAPSWTISEIADMFERWVVAGWQNRPHKGLRHPSMPGRALTPNEMYSAAVTACGYVPLPLSGTDYLELLSVKWCAVNDDGLNVNSRRYDGEMLNGLRRRDSGVSTKRGLWEVRLDPYDCSMVWLRDSLHDNIWLTVPWEHHTLVSAPFAEHTWQAAREIIIDGGGDRHDREAIARVLADLLHEAAHPPRRAGPAPSAAGYGTALPHDLGIPRYVDEPEPDTATPEDTERTESAHVRGLGVFDPLNDSMGWP